MKHLRHSSLYICTLFVEPLVTPITTNPLLRAVGIPNTTLWACGIVFWVSLRGIAVCITWTQWQTQSCKDIINCFLLSTVLPWPGFPFIVHSTLIFLFLYQSFSLLQLCSCVLSPIVSLLWFSSYVLSQFSLPPFFSQLQPFSTSVSSVIHTALAFKAGLRLLVALGTGRGKARISDSTSPLDNLDFPESAKFGVHLLCLPSHTTHVLQPLDVGMFTSFKRNFSKACSKYLAAHPGRVIQVINWHLFS